MDALTALLRAHCVAAQAWRYYMLSPNADNSDAWHAAERALTRVLEAGRC